MKASHSSIVDRIIKISEDYGANCLILFGSYAKTPYNASDIDIACDVGRLKHPILFPRFWYPSVGKDIRVE